MTSKWKTYNRGNIFSSFFMTANALKSSVWLSVVTSPYLRDDGTAKTIAEILGKTENGMMNLWDFSEALQSRVKVDINTITLTWAEGVQRTFSKRIGEHKLSAHSAGPLSKKDILVFIQEAFGKNDMKKDNENFFMLGGKDDVVGREVVAFFHSVVWLDSGKHYWLADEQIAIYIDINAQMLYIIKLDKNSEAYSF